MQKQQTPLWYPTILPWLPSPYDDDIIESVRAFQRGKANESQQLLAWRYLMYITGASDEFQDLSFRPGGTEGRRASDFAEGKRFVGMQIRKFLRPELNPKPPAPLTPPTLPARLKVRRRTKAMT